MAPPVPPRRRSSGRKAPPSPLADSEPVAPAVPAVPEVDPLTRVDPDAMQAAWFDLCTEHEAEREVKEIKARTDWVMREARQRKAYELRVSARLPYRTIAEQLGVSVATAYHDVVAFTSLAVPVSEREVARRESIELYERLLREMLIGMTQADGPAKLPFISQVVQVQTRLDKAHGVESPVQIVDMSELKTVDEIDAAAAQLVAEMDFLTRNNLLTDQ